MNDGQLRKFCIFPDAGSLRVKNNKSVSLVLIISQFWEIRLSIVLVRWYWLFTLVKLIIRNVFHKMFNVSESSWCRLIDTCIYNERQKCRDTVILEYLRQIYFLISIIRLPPPFSMFDFLSLEFASFLCNIEKGEGVIL